MAARVSFDTRAVVREEEDRLFAYQDTLGPVEVAFTDRHGGVSQRRRTRR